MSPVHMWCDLKCKVNCIVIFMLILLGKTEDRRPETGNERPMTEDVRRPMAEVAAFAFSSVYLVPGNHLTGATKLVLISSITSPFCRSNSSISFWLVTILS